MVKRIAKYGFKSGILPKPRQIIQPFKTKLEIEAEEKANVGFVDPDFIPKPSGENTKTAAKVPLKERIPAKVLIENSSKAPEPTDDRTEWKKLNSALRRAYYQDSLTRHEQIEYRLMKKRELKEQQAKEEELRKSHPELSKQSEATILTLPTIEKFLTNGEFVVQRTPAEKKLLAKRREANRINEKITQKSRQYKTFLELYNNANNFIVDAQKLESIVKLKFGDAANNLLQFNSLSSEVDQLDMNRPIYDASKVVPPSALKSGDKLSSLEIARVADYLVQELHGITSNGDPGLSRVEDALSGKTLEQKKALTKLIEEERARREKLIKAVENSPEHPPNPAQI